VLKSGFDHIHQIFTYFKSIEWQQSGQSLFDKTLFVITSEFSRTPYLNSARGKDHNPMTNSVILAGSGVKGGSTLGGSRLITAAQSKSNFAYHMGRPIDKSSGLIAGGKENSMFIFPEMVLMTIGQILGWQMSDLQSIPKDTPHLPWVLK
jgi:hypothetical protein